jgi:hypothetical protein
MLLNWSGKVVPALVMPSIQYDLCKVGHKLARSGVSSASDTLPPSDVDEVTPDGEITHTEEVTWSVTLLSGEAIIGGIGGCSFRVQTRFKDQPLLMDVLIPHSRLKAEAEA